MDFLGDAITTVGNIDGETVTALATLLLALVTLGLVIAAFLQIRAGRKAMALQASLELFHEWRSNSFVQHRHVASDELRLTREQLIKDPNIRFGTLPINMKESITTVSHFFDETGLLVRRGLLDKKVVLNYVAGSIKNYWELFEPFIKREREYRKSVGYSPEKSYYYYQMNFEWLYKEAKRFLEK